MKVMLVDDEQLALDMLEMTLKKISDEIEIVAKFTEPQKAFKSLENVSVDVIFLDMEMGSLHGLKLAREISERYRIPTIFVTAYAQFALEAFEVEAIDYLLKPIQKERLEKALEKVKERLPLLKNQSTDVSKETSELFVHAIGSFKLIDHNKAIVKWRTRKAQELFVFLWHQDNEPVHKARVVEELWPHTDSTKVVGLMHTTIYQIRKTLRELGFDQAVELVNEHYILRCPIASDVSEINAIINSNEFTSENVRKLLTLFHDEYLAEEHYEWALQTRHEINRRCMNYLMQFVEDNFDDEHHCLLVEQCLKKLVALDCYNERYLIYLIHCYGKQYDVHKLIELYDTIKRSFEEELDVPIPHKVKEAYRTYLP